MSLPSQALALVSSALLALAPASLALAQAQNAPRVVPLDPPAAATMPAGPLGDAIRLGQRVVTDTQGTVKANVGNGLNCTSCHLDAGRTAYAAPLAGLTGLFPEYRARTGTVETLEERIIDCFERSMNGKPLAHDSPAMIGLLAYIAWLSQGVPTGSEVAGRGFRKLAAASPPDSARGRTLYAARCAMCHGADGRGVRAGGGYAMPPLWGPDSFNTGAGMARIETAAAFVQAKMPLNTPGALTSQDAFDIAAFFTAQARPAFRAPPR